MSRTFETCGCAGADARRDASAQADANSAVHGGRRSLAGVLLRSLYVLAIRRGRPETIRWP